MKLIVLFATLFILSIHNKTLANNLNNIPLENIIDDSLDYNFFSPNNDSINDYFFIPKINTGEIRNAKFSVFNRWGDLVFEEDPFLNKWDGLGNQMNVKGKELPEGVYIYRLEYDILDKTTSILGKIILKR
jgi:gliding motility-associated-like protein